MTTGEERLPKRIQMIAAALALAASAVPGAAQGPSAAQADEIVVTAQRTGIPVWRVNSPTTTLVLIGSIEDVARDTKWDPAALTETLVKADRIMFPSITQVSASPFSMIGYLVKWRKQATLPGKQTLQSMLPPAQYQRLVALQRKGVLKGGWERKHPLHLAIMLRDIAEGKRGNGPSASSVVRRAVAKHKLRMVPIASVKAKSVAGDFFATPPKAYLPCLMDSVALVEAGPGTVKARSDAWAQRRVPAVLSSPAEKVQESCLPPAFRAVPKTDLRVQVRSLLAQPQVTVAVVELGTLARPGGVLDSLAAAGFDVRGPRWKS
jgi:uncharacterized protein YbaP (TraB family)